MRLKMESSNPGLSFAAQPAALTMAVSFTDGVKPHLARKPFDYNGTALFALAHNRTFDTCAADEESVLIGACRGTSG
jgi:hypothetical protein